MRIVGLLLLSFALAVPAALWADSPPANPTAVIAQARSDLRAASAGLNTKALADSDIQARLALIPPIQAKLTSILAVLTPRLQDLLARQVQLGALSAVAGPEDPLTLDTSHKLTWSLANVTAEVKEARLLSLTGRQVTATLSDRLRENFTARLWTQSRSIVDPGLWRDFAGEAPGDLNRVGVAIGDEADQARMVKASARNIALIAGALVFSLFLMGPGRVISVRLGYRRAGRGGGGEPRVRRIILALWLVLVASGTPLLAGLALKAALNQTGALTPDVDGLMLLLIRAAVFASLLESLGRALLSPRRPEWRLAPAPEAMVARLAAFPGLIGAAAALSMFVVGLNSLLGISLATRVATDCLSVLLEVVVVGAALAAIGRARVANRAKAPSGPSPAEADSRLPWLLATFGAWFAVAGAAIALMAGYLALANFLMREMVWIVAILGLLFLLARLADDLFPSLMAPDAPLGGALETALGLSSGTMDQLGVLLSGVTRLLLLLLASVAVFAPVGASFEDILQRFTATDFVVRLGLVSISPGAVLGGIALFLAGIAITRAVRRWLEVRYLPKTNMDLGLRTSLAAGVTYLGALAAVLVAFAYLGLSVAQIALFASALSVGIGFGLQAIIGNFVSGLILLAERPVRVGDWIAIGDLEGDVRKINIRATEIEMMDHSRLIVPNSDLVSKTVRNITHSGALGRVRIVLKVEASADPAKVRDLLLARLTAHPKVLKEPAPLVYLTDIREAALEFTAFAYLTSPRLAYGVKSDLLLAIVPDLRAAGVALASATTVVNVELADRSREPHPADLLGP